MLDTMTATKIVGGFCGMLLIFLLGGWVAETIYHTGDPYAVEQAYRIDTGEEEVDNDVEPEPEVPFEVVYASADASAGERLWRQCAACHNVEEPINSVGPHLVDIVGREKAVVDGFNYSNVLTGMESEWTPENLSGFIENPRGYAPGTSMSYNGMRNIEDRANLIAWLENEGS